MFLEKEDFGNPLHFAVKVIPRHNILRQSLNNFQKRFLQKYNAAFYFQTKLLLGPCRFLITHIQTSRNAFK